MNKFERLMESSPKTAIKEIEKFKKSIFWEFFIAQMELTRHLLVQKLKTCDLDEVEFVRARLFENERLMDFPQSQIERIDDVVAIEEDAFVKQMEGAKKT